MSIKKIKFIKDGFTQCGEYVAGEVYEVETDIAEHLINAKGFIEVSDAAEEPQNIHTEAFSDNEEPD